MEVTTTYLEQTDPGDLRPAREPAEALVVTRAELVSPELNRYLYTAVGGDWFWLDRLGWTWRQWREWLDRPGVETWVGTVAGTPIGYVELDGAATEGEVEVAYFGLLPGFLGRGLGGHLLTVGLREAWRLGERWPGRAPVRRVWLHTCTLDGPAALANYEARGLRAYRTERETTELPAEPTGPWPGAGPRN